MSCSRVSRLMNVRESASVRKVCLQTTDKGLWHLGISYDGSKCVQFDWWFPYSRGSMARHFDPPAECYDFRVGGGSRLYFDKYLVKFASDRRQKQQQKDLALGTINASNSRLKQTLLSIQFPTRNAFLVSTYFSLRLLVLQQTSSSSSLDFRKLNPKPGDGSMSKFHWEECVRPGRTNLLEVSTKLWMASTFPIKLNMPISWPR